MIISRVLVLFLLITLAGPAAAAERVDLMIAGGTVVTMDGEGRVLENGAVAVRGGRIVAIGETATLAARYRAARTVDARGRVVMPGLVNAHTHVPMVLFRGIADDLRLMEWLQKFIFPAEARNVDEEFVRWGTRLACLEMLRGGVTTFADMYYFEDAIAEETARAGMRAVLGETLIDFPAPDNKTWDAGIAYTERFLARWKGHPLVTPAVAPHALYTVGPEHFKAAHALAARHGAPMLTHLAEDDAELATSLERYGARPIAHLDRLGVLDGRVTAAHVIGCDREEAALLARRGVGVAHCPQSNMKVAAGVAPVPQMLAAGVAVGLGTDGAASNNDLNLWEEMDTAAKLHKVVTKDPTVLPAREVLRMGTIGGARALHLDREIGSLEPGKRADIAIVRVDGLHQTPSYDVYSLLVYSTKASDVETVIVEGRVVMRAGRVLTIDERAVRAKAAAYRERIRASVAASER